METNIQPQEPRPETPMPSPTGVSVDSEESTWYMGLCPSQAGLPLKKQNGGPVTLPH
ncbi:Hypothetical predicted protein [Podarcis lilfordi]|uniref:Uncharacterized protein n=1 Tax=Podarcis lilfordi TaxID=74358 RepID=A0AA35LDC5_9SAUR|nr:Hypothetical predicted protein [Podarcis lilfordi]